MKQKVFICIVQILRNLGRTKVIIGYLSVVVMLLASTAWSVDWNMKNGGNIHLAFIPTSISLLTLLFLGIVTVPVCQYLYPSKTLYVAEKNIWNIYYLPFFESVFKKMDLEHYHFWSSEISIQGTLLISESQYHALHTVKGMLNRAVRHEGNELVDGLIVNLASVIDDLLYVMDSHLVMRADNMFTMKRFYKAIYPNPNYDEDLDRYMKIVRLISDLTLEMTRLLNLILSIIREYNPGFMIEVGTLVIADAQFKNYNYRESEISSSPYPGLKDFLRVRATRECYMDDSTDLDLENL